MNKKKWTALLLAGMMAVMMIPQAVLAKDVTANWKVTFTSAGKMESTFKSKEVNEKVSGMQPGDSVSFTVTTASEYAKATDWYLKNDVLHSLEESTKAAKAGGGAYSYKLVYKDNTKNKEVVLFDSDTVGGDNANEGLKDATSSLDGWTYLGSLTKGGKGGTVTLTVLLEGETQGNRYQDTAADLELKFGVEIPAEKKANGSSIITRNAKTGDSNRMLLYGILAGAAGIVLLVYAILAAKRRKEEEAQAAAEGGKGDVR